MREGDNCVCNLAEFPVQIFIFITPCLKILVLDLRQNNQIAVTSVSNSKITHCRFMMEDNALPKPRPVLVSLLAILTIVGAIFSFGFAGLQALVPELSRNSVPIPIWLTTIAFVLIAGKLVAAILLLRMRRIGFFMYAGLESLAAILSIIEGKIGMDYLDAGYTLDRLPIDPALLILLSVGFRIGLSILFIGGHAAHLGKMK